MQVTEWNYFVPVIKHDLLNDKVYLVPISPVSQARLQIAYQKQYVLHHKLKYLNIRVDIALHIAK